MQATTCTGAFTQTLQVPCLVTKPSSSCSTSCDAISEDGLGSSSYLEPREPENLSAQINSEQGASGSGAAAVCVNIPTSDS